MKFFDGRNYRVLKAPLLNGAGTQNAGNANYVSANSSIARFELQSDGAVLIPLGLQIIIEDVDSDYNRFGNQAALSNGLQIRIEEASDNSVIFDCLYGAKITNVQTAFRLGADIQPLNDSSGATRSTNIWLPFFGRQKINHNEQLAVLHADNITVSGLYYWLHYVLDGGLGS